MEDPNKKLPTVVNQSLTNEQRERLYLSWKELGSVRAVIDQSKLSSGCVSKYKKLDNWEERKATEERDAKEVYDHSKRLQDVPLSDIREDTIREMEIALNLRAKKIREALANGEEEDGITNELQKMAAALEKSQVIEIKKQTGGVERTAHMELKCDIVELTKLQMEAKRWGIDISGKDLLSNYEDIRKQIERKQQNS